GADPISDPALLRAVLKVIKNAGVLHEAMKDWHKKPTANRTWANAQTFFKTENKERLRLATASTLGYNAANAASNRTTDPTNNTNAASTPGTTQSWYYCWTHGLATNPNHTSATCTNPAPGHCTTATLDNMQGGNAKIRRKQGERAVYRPPNAREEAAEDRKTVQVIKSKRSRRQPDSAATKQAHRVLS
ncbi:MAG: hypothetical protein AAF529_24175, partial [Pseudomonadota bacterium]